MDVLPELTARIEALEAKVFGVAEPDNATVAETEAGEGALAPANTGTAAPLVPGAA